MNAADPGLVSVIVPFFNHSEWLLEALESVLSQSYNNWEAIVVDDGSHPDHAEAAIQYCLRHPAKMRYIEHEGHVNRGVTISRNVGIEASRGNFIALLDADDKWLPKKLELQIDLFSRFPTAEMICEASLFWFSWENSSIIDTVKPIGTLADILYPATQLTKILYPLGDGAPPCPSGIIMRRAAFVRSGGFEPAFSGVFQLYEDQALLAKIYLKETVYVSGRANNMYRKRSDSMSSALGDKVIYTKVRTFFLDWLEQYMSAEGIVNEEVIRLIQTARQTMFDVDQSGMIL